MSANVLKRLQVRSNELLKLTKEIDGEICRLKSEKQSAEKEREEIKSKIKQLTEVSESVLISEHAMLRYFERVLGYDLDAIREEMVPPKIVDQIHTLKSGTFPTGKCKLRVKNKMVVTVLSP